MELVRRFDSLFMGDRHYNLVTLATTVLKDRESCITWCQQQGLLPSTLQCEYCSKPCTFKIGRNSSIGEFRCQRKHGNHRGEFSQSAAKGTWFAGARVPPEVVIILIYCYAHDMSYADAIRETSIPSMDTTRSSETVCDWYQYMEEVVEDEVLNKQNDEGLLGAPGKIVSQSHIRRRIV
jgi:hypothetical protein